MAKVLLNSLCASNQVQFCGVSAALSLIMSFASSALQLLVCSRLLQKACHWFLFAAAFLLHDVLIVNQQLNPSSVFSVYMRLCFIHPKHKSKPRDFDFLNNAFIGIQTVKHLHSPLISNSKNYSQNLQKILIYEQPTKTTKQI